VRYLPLHVLAQRLITAYLEASGHDGDFSAPLFRPVKNNWSGWKRLGVIFHTPGARDPIRPIKKHETLENRLCTSFGMRAHIDGEDLVCREPGFRANQLRLAQGVEVAHEN
jgi:hypothetical protein